MIKVKSPKDFWAGLLFIAFGLFFLLASRRYKMGTAMHMGPAYFPAMLGGLIAVIGGIVLFHRMAFEAPSVHALLFAITTPPRRSITPRWRFTPARFTRCTSAGRRTSAERPTW